MKRRKREIFVNWKKTFWTNKLEYYVLESERIRKMAVQSSRRNEKMKKRRRWGGGGRARRTIFNYAENALAEMATVLRKDATILIPFAWKDEVTFQVINNFASLLRTSP